jgi:hypothetical protein
MHAKNNGRPLPALPLSADVTTSAIDNAPAKGLSAALGAALGGGHSKPQFPGGKLTGAPHGPDTLNRAPKPIGGANRTMSPRQGHR